MSSLQSQRRETNVHKSLKDDEKLSEEIVDFENLKILEYWPGFFFFQTLFPSP